MATAAPRVEPAVATGAPQSESVRIDPARPSAAPMVEKAQRVEPAVPFVSPPPTTTVQRAEAMSVAALRNKSGEHFESYAAVIKGAAEKNFLKRVLPCIFDERDFVAYGEVQRFVLVKGNCCFVYGEEFDVRPLYAISLEDVRPYMEDRRFPDKQSITVSPTTGNIGKGDLTTVLLKDSATGKQAFQFTFNTSADRSLAKRFYDAIEQASAKTTTASVMSSKPTVNKSSAKV